MVRNYLLDAIHEKNIQEHEWLELIQRLMDYGVICRDESRIEAELYDRYLRIESLVVEYLSLMGVRILHDAHFEFLRLLPPGARIAGLEDDFDQPFNGGLRSRLGQHEVALLLVLRAEYDKSLREGKVDEWGCVTVSTESLLLSLKNILARTLPENVSERRQLFKRLRQLRVIRYASDEEVVDGESWIKVRPMILNMVNAEAIAHLEQSLPDDLDGDGQNPIDSGTDDQSRRSAIEDSASRSLFESTPVQE